MKKKGFTLIELLAVIIILGVVSAIAIPKITKILKKSKLESIENSVSIIAEAAEREYISRTAGGVLDQENDEITCQDVSNISDANYENCQIIFDTTGTATVTIAGDGKFAGYTCRGDKIAGNCASDGASLATAESCFATEPILESYDINVANCVAFAEYLGWADDPVGSNESWCTDGALTDNYTIRDDISEGYFFNYKLNDLIEHNVLSNMAISAFTIVGYDGECDKEIIIPRTINTKPILKIGDDAFTVNGDIDGFSYNSLNQKNKIRVIPISMLNISLGINSVEIPNTITEIGERAFEQSNLTTLTIPNSVTVIGENAFDGNQLTNVRILSPSFNSSNLPCAFDNNDENLTITFSDNITLNYNDIECIQ